MIVHDAAAAFQQLLLAALAWAGIVGAGLALTVCGIAYAIHHAQTRRTAVPARHDYQEAA